MATAVSPLALLQRKEVPTTMGSPKTLAEIMGDTKSKGLAFPPPHNLSQDILSMLPRDVIGKQTSKAWPDVPKASPQEPQFDLMKILGDVYGGSTKAGVDILGQAGQLGQQAGNNALNYANTGMELLGKAGEVGGNVLSGVGKIGGDVISSTGEYLSKPETQQWIADFMQSPQALQLAGSATQNPYSATALLSESEQVKKQQQEQKAIERKALLEQDMLNKKAALNPYTDTPIQSYDKEGKPVAVYMPKPEFAGLMNPKIVPLGDVQKEIPKPTLTGDYILPGETTPRPLNVVNGNIVDPKTDKDVTSIAKVYVKPEKVTKSPEEVLAEQDARTLSKAQQKTKIDIADSVSTIDQLKKLEAVMKKISPNGALSRGMGGVRQLLSIVVPDKDLADYKAMKSQLLSNIARNFGGEKGVLSDPDIKRIEDGFPRPTDSSAEVEAKMSAIYDLVNSRIYAKLNAVNLSPSDVGFKPLSFGTKEVESSSISLPPPREGERANGYIYKNGKWKQEEK